MAAPGRRAGRLWPRLGVVGPLVALAQAAVLDLPTASLSTPHICPRWLRGAPADSVSPLLVGRRTGGGRLALHLHREGRHRAGHLVRADEVPEAAGGVAEQPAHQVRLLDVMAVDAEPAQQAGAGHRAAQVLLRPVQPERAALVRVAGLALLAAWPLRVRRAERRPWFEVDPPVVAGRRAQALRCLANVLAALEQHELRALPGIGLRALLPRSRQPCLQCSGQAEPLSQLGRRLVGRDGESGWLGARAGVVGLADGGGGGGDGVVGDSREDPLPARLPPLRCRVRCAGRSLLVIPAATPFRCGWNNWRD